MELVMLLVSGLASWRLTYMLIEDDGPLDVFAKFRKFVGVTYDEHGYPVPKTSFSKGLMCFYCQSIWWGFIFGLSYVFLREATLLLAFPFALSTVALLIRRLMNV